MGACIGSGDGRRPERAEVSVSDLIKTIVRDTEEVILGRIEGEEAYHGVLLEGGGKYVEEVSRELQRDGFSAIFREGDLILPNLNLYSINVDELIDTYERGNGLIEG